MEEDNVWFEHPEHPQKPSNCLWLIIDPGDNHGLDRESPAVLISKASHSFEVRTDPHALVWSVHPIQQPLTDSVELHDNVRGQTQCGTN
jgi:hypothetical protein